MKRGLIVVLAAALVAGLVYLGLRRAPDSTPDASAPVTMTPSTQTETAVTLTGATPTGAMTADEFRRLTDRVEAGLPTFNQVKNLREEELHHTPKILIQAGADIGDVAEAVAHNPELAPQAAAFYARCAHREELATTVRALCLANARKSAKQSGTPVDEMGISSDVSELAGKLTF